MNKQLLLWIGLCLGISGYAQVDTAKNDAPHNDTIRIGNMIIVKDARGKSITSESTDSAGQHRHHYKPSNVKTDWIIFDIGFTNYNDRTDYASAGTQQFAPGATSDWFRLRTGKSVDVNIWLFMQRINLIKHVVNFKYGLGIELNNYRYEENIKFLVNPTKVIMDTINYSKNKLALDYVTVPFMLNFNLTPHKKEDYGFSVGASVGYQYSSRQKFKSGVDGKQKTFNDFDTEPWKISWIGELRLGWISFYGSYAAKSMFRKGLDQRPYTFGLRLGGQ